MELLAVSPVNTATHPLVSLSVKAGRGTHGAPPGLWQPLLPVELSDLAIFLPHQVPGVDGVVLVGHRVVMT